MHAGTVTDSISLEAQCLTPSIPDPNGEIARQIRKLTDCVNAHCTGVPLATLFPGLDASCHASAAALGTCIKRHVQCRACAALNEADGTVRNCDLFDDGTANSSCGVG